MEGRKIQIVYHSPCCDGFWACLPLFLFYRGTADFRFLPYANGQREELQLQDADCTYFLDTTAAPAVEDALRCSAAVIVIDHHSDTLDKLQRVSSAHPPQSIEVIHSAEKAACVLAWEYFASRRSPLSGSVETDASLWRFLEYVQDRDLYLLRLPESAEVTAGLAEVVTDQRLDRNCGALEDLLRLDLEAVKKVGVRPARRREKEIELEMRKKVILIRIGEDKAKTCFCMLTTKRHIRSELAQLLSRYSDTRFNFPLGAVAIEQSDSQLRLSLRTTGDIDVAAICQLHGGGGHRRAAGMMVPKRLFWRKWVCGKEFYLPN